VAFPSRKATFTSACKRDLQEKCSTPEAYGNDALRQKLIEAALHFTGSLPKKKQ
jgi:hypothetical protein